MKASDVAQYFLLLQDDEAGDISNMKLQKLLYYAQGYHLAMFDAPLFEEKIMAWMHGPVIPELYSQYKKYGTSPIPKPEGIDLSSFSPETLDFLREVYRTVGQFSAWKLRDMTHAETPWAEAYDVDNPREISLDSMKAYFKALVA